MSSAEPSPETLGWRFYFTGKQGVLTLALVTLVFARSVDQVLFYRLNYEFSFFVWYLATIILPIAFLVISFPVVLYKQYFTEDITPTMISFPKYKFAIMGLFDTLFNLFSTLPVQHLGSNLTNVLSQSVLPINMLFAVILLKTRYKANHYLGAVLVIYGVALALDGSGGFGWISLLVFSQTFAAASNVYKEVGMKGADLDVWYANLWVGVFQLLWGGLTFWTIYIYAFTDPHPAIDSGHAFTQFFKQSNDCFFGKVVDVLDVEQDSCIGGNPTWDANDDDCLSGTCKGTCHFDCGFDFSMPMYLFFIFIVFNITYNQLMLYVFREGSSVLFVVANAVRLPLVSMLAMWKWVSGPAYEEMTKMDGFALFILVVAIGIYYSQPEVTESPDGQTVEGDEDDIGLIASPPVPGIHARYSRESIDGKRSTSVNSSDDLSAPLMNP